MRKEEKRSPNGLLFYFSMKVLLLETRNKIETKDMDRVYNNIVMQIRTNAITMIPDCIAAYDVVDIDAVAFDKDGKLLLAPVGMGGETYGPGL